MCIKKKKRGTQIQVKLNCLTRGIFYCYMQKKKSEEKYSTGNTI